MNFRMELSISAKKKKNAGGILSEIALNLQITLG